MYALHSNYHRHSLEAINRFGPICQIVPSTGPPTGGFKAVLVFAARVRARARARVRSRKARARARSEQNAGAGKRRRGEIYESGVRETFNLE